MIISKSDPISRYIKNNDIIDSILFNNLLSWKFNCIKTIKDVIFIKPTDSNYILAISSLSTITKVYGFWDIETTQGNTTKGTSIEGLKNLLIIVVPPVQLSSYNTEIFDKVSSPSKSLENKAFEILCRLVTSTTHSNKSNTELAIKSLKLAMEFKNQYDDAIVLLSKSSII